MPSPFDRRQFLAASAAAAATPLRAPETLVTTLYRSLKPEQTQAVCFAYDDPLRQRVENNWLITPHKIGQFFNADQQAMIAEIFRGLHNPEFVERALSHVKEDAGGIQNLAIAIFGEPGTSQSEFVITGRHCTSRCDGNTRDGVAFAGPIMYGHQAGPNDMEPADHRNNVYWFQAQKYSRRSMASNAKQHW